MQDPRPTRRRRTDHRRRHRRRTTAKIQDHYDADAAAESALLHFSTPRDPATISATLRTRVYRPGSLIWPQGRQAPRRRRAESEITGLYAVPYETA
ncbi:hypothetical protein ACFYPK_24365 [Streptomyces halstedii]|uniref:hypothetical protein n=1 Tax=Streptomyces halstedii TaxID=1944 RepID=UPI0036C90FEE